jgi:hypothetical protein
MKKFCVAYNITTTYDASVSAETKKEAMAKVQEVIGSGAVMEGAWELRENEIPLGNGYFARPI